MGDSETWHSICIFLSSVLSLVIMTFKLLQVRYTLSFATITYQNLTKTLWGSNKASHISGLKFKLIPNLENHWFLQRQYIICN